MVRYCTLFMNELFALLKNSFDRWKYYKEFKEDEKILPRAYDGIYRVSC
jgi:hypothetical protein